MRLPIRNAGNGTLTIVLEPTCEQFEIPVGGEAIIRLEDGRPHSIDIEDACVTVFDEGADATVEVICKSDMQVDEALSLVGVWLHRLGAPDEAMLVRKAVDDLEIAFGYFAARAEVFGAFHQGFSAGDVAPQMADASPAPWKNEILAECQRAGITGARLNRAARRAISFPELRAAPFDTDTARAAFARALAAIRNRPQQSGAQ